MISIENHPPDPSSSSVFPLDQNRNLKFTTSDGKASDSVTASDNKLAIVEEEKKRKNKVDLFDDSTRLPKFSIRDYVFSSRSKDIAVNWPFSQKNLELCLRHGVTNLLPPFQDSCISRCHVENSLPDQEIVSSCDGESSRPIDPRFVSATSGIDKFNAELALDSSSINFSKSPCSEFEADTSLEASEEKSEAPTVSRKAESSIQINPVKKCRLVVKLGQVVEPVSASEDITPHNFMVSEAMASKVCPVCKTFSSSSNTTLNAHIDQCLSGESTMKWTATCKVIKHRIKPRKTRLMVDIYETAPHCTLEELDRRNGTNWATNSTFPAQEIEFHEEQKEERAPVNLEDTGREGDVYIDTNGTKVRILSVPKPGTGDDQGSQKSMKGAKGNKFVTSKKRKKLLEQKHHKYLKLVPHGKKSCSPKPHRGFETRRCEQENSTLEESCKKEYRQKLRFSAQRQTKLDDLETIKPWACSRRTVHVKKSCHKHGNLHSGYNSTKDLLVETEESSLGVLRTPNSSDNPISSPKNNKGLETSSYECQDYEHREQALPRKMVVFQSASPVDSFGKRRSDKQAPSPRNKAVETNADPSRKDDGFHISSTASPFAAVGKNLLSVSRKSMHQAKFNLKRKYSVLQKAQVDQSHDPLHGSTERQSGIEEEFTGKLSAGRLRVLKMKKKGEIKIYGKEEPTALKSPPLRPMENADSTVHFEAALEKSSGDVESAREEIQTRGEDIVIDPASKIDVEGSFMTLSKSLSPDQFHKLVSSPDSSQFGSQQRIGINEGPLCGAEVPVHSPPSLDDKNKMFCADDMQIGIELESKDVDQENYFPDVDPIPIPGPPGSFLPSPGGDMVSEDLPGNSSLTTSRVQSSEDHHDMVDRDSSSDSPISATSTISNPSLPRSESRSPEKLSVRSLAGQDESRPGFSSARIEDNVDMTFPEKGLIGLKNDQPCCCSRKDGVSQTAALNHQESPLQRRRALDSNKRPVSLNFRSEMFSLSSYPNSLPEAVAVKSPAGHAPLAASTDSEVKFSIHSDCDSAASPSSSKPVLRLMGKNLMVIKKDEDESPQLRPPPLNQQFSSFSGACHGNFQNEDYHSFRRVLPQGNIIFGKNQNDLESPRFDGGLPNGFISHADLVTPQTPIYGSAKAFPSTIPIAGGLMPSLERYVLDGSHLGPTPQYWPHQDRTVDWQECGSHLSPTPQSRPKKRLDTQWANDKNAYSTSNPVKEIIVIDDSPENEADLTTEYATRNHRMGRNWASSSSISFQSPSGYNSRNVNSFYRSQNSSPYAGSPVLLRNASFQNPSFGEVNASLSNRNCIPEGSLSRLDPDSLAAPPSQYSSGHPLRSTVCYSPRFS